MPRAIVGTHRIGIYRPGEHAGQFRQDRFRARSPCPDGAPPPRVLSYRATISVPESTAHNINSWMSAPDGDGIALVHPGQQPWAVWYFVGGG